MNENKYNFNRIKMDCNKKPTFYCYSGCNFFSTKNELLQHLYEGHDKKELKAWGLNRALIKKFLLADENKSLSKRKKK